MFKLIVTKVLEETQTQTKDEEVSDYRLQFKSEWLEKLKYIPSTLSVQSASNNNCFQNLNAIIESLCGFGLLNNYNLDIQLNTVGSRD